MLTEVMFYRAAGNAVAAMAITVVWVEEQRSLLCLCLPQGRCCGVCVGLPRAQVRGNGCVGGSVVRMVTCHHGCGLGVGVCPECRQLPGRRRRVVDLSPCPSLLCPHWPAQYGTMHAIFVIFRRKPAEGAEENSSHLLGPQNTGPEHAPHTHKHILTTTTQHTIISALQHTKAPT